MVPRQTNLSGVQISWQKWFIVFILAVGSIMVGTALTRLHWCQRYLSRGANSCFVMELIFDAVFIGLIIAYFTAHSEIMNSLLIFLSVRSSNWHFKSIFLWRIHSAWLWLRSISQSAIVQPLWLLWWWRNTQKEKQQRLFVLAWEPANGIYSEWGEICISGYYSLALWVLLMQSSLLCVKVSL